MGWKHIHYIALWMIAIYLQSLITRRPQVQVLSPQPCLTADFVRNQRFFILFGGFGEAEIGVPAPTVPQRGIKLGEWILWRLQNMCRYFVFKWFMRYNICTCPLCNPPMRLIYLHSIILADYKNRREKLLYEVSP